MIKSIRFPFLVLAVTAALSSAGFAQEARTGAVDFENDLIPVFTRFGCNAGTCHGAAIGRGGFKLSLFGGNPRADYGAVARQVEGSRINLARPEQSLIILKPTESITHGGGVKGGQVLGSSDLLGESPKDNPITPADLATTVYTLLGIDTNRELHTADGRPVRVGRDGARVITELIG